MANCAAGLVSVVYGLGMDIAGQNSRLAEIYSGTSWVMVADAAAGIAPLVEVLKGWGVDRILLLAGTDGVGEIPDDIEIHYTAARGDTIMGGIRAFERSLLSESVNEVLDAFDPSGEARVMSPPFGADDAFSGRRVYGRRRPEWRVLEDKTTIDTVFDAAEVLRAPSMIVSVADAVQAARGLSTDLGTVWAADNRDGWHGGGEYTRWVSGEGDFPAATEWSSRRADLVRVMPFLDGLPCSIHGYVTEGGVGTFRPVEMLVGRVPDRGSFYYMGMATTWDPTDRFRDHMRRAADRVGRHLAKTVGYRGPFSIDGVATADGFIPTELNPRMSAGFGIQTRGIDDLNIGLLTRAIYEADIDVDPAELERLIVGNADANRAVRIGIPVPEQCPKAEIGIRVDDDEVVVAVDSTHGTLAIGPSPGGSYVLLTIDDVHLPVGRSAAGLAVSATALAGELWDIAVPAIEVAVDVSG